ncbi:MAG TPA: hypothetical protein VE973_01265 [Candidatus Limnocylindria bacterium]|nr:hypothetical protein [Candidatus Limnocylindria bacterium]
MANNTQGNLALANDGAQGSPSFQRRPAGKVLAFKSPKENKNRQIIQKGAQLAGEVARFADKDNLGKKMDSISSFAAGKNNARPNAGQDQSNLTESRQTQPQPKNLTGSAADIKFVEKYEDTEEILFLAEELARMTGFEEVGDMAELIRDGLHNGTLSAQDLKNGDAGAIRRNLARGAGNFASDIAEGKGKKGAALNALIGKGTLDSASAAGLGGAVSAALQGEGAVGIAESAGSWYIIDFAIPSLITPWSPLALLYLDFHYIAAKFGSKLFRMPSLWQRVIIWTANIVYVIGIGIIILLLFFEVCNDPIYSRVIGTTTNTGYIGKAQGLIFGSGEICGAFSLANYAISKANSLSATSTPPTAQ